MKAGERKEGEGRLPPFKFKSGYALEFNIKIHNEHERNP